jgi:hypothetical protein
VLVLSCAALVGVMPGCAKPKPRAKVTGTVKLNGKPLPGGMVSFALDDGTNVSAGTNIRKDGTYEVANAPIGKCKVAVKTSHLNTTPTPVVTAPAAGAGVNMQPKQTLVPGASGDPKMGTQYTPIAAKFEDVTKSGLEFEVKPGENNFDIPVTDK